MASVNTKPQGVRTHEGTSAVPIGAEPQLRRALNRLFPGPLVNMTGA